MSKKIKAEKIKAAAKSKETNADAKAAPLKPTAPAKKESPHFDFIGKVESVSVKSGAAAGFEFTLHGRKGALKTFCLDAANSTVMSIMANVVISAHAGGEKIGVRVSANGEGNAVAVEIAFRRKLGKAE